MCHRYAPHTMLISDDSPWEMFDERWMQAVFPITFAEDWCGDGEKGLVTPDTPKTSDVPLHQDVVGGSEGVLD